MQKSTLHIVLVLFVLLQAASCAYPSLGFAAIAAAPEGPAAAVYHVSRTGSNGDGRSWATAWNELDQIDWNVIGPGDTILIDGGPVACRYAVAVTGSSNTPAPAGCGMVYRTALVIGASGTVEAPVTIRLAEEAGRDGTVRIFGGRATPLPYCGQTSYAPDRPGTGHGIIVNGRSHIVMDGGHWSGIMVYGWTRGVFLSWNGDNQRVTLRNAEVFDNGAWSANNGSDEEAITGGGTGLLFERLILHDNGQDQFQTGYKLPVNDAVFRRSWFYNQRPHPTVRGEPFNYCMHSDGIQFFGDLTHSDITIEDSIVGPGLMHGMMLGEIGRVDRVTVRNSLFVGYHGEANNASFLIKDTLSGRDSYVFDRVTMVRDAGAKGWNIYAPGSGYEVRDSLFVGGREVRIGEGAKTGNVCWDISDYTGVCNQRVGPQFVDGDYAGIGEGFAGFDFTITNPAIAQGVGSSITSVAGLLADTAPPSASISELPSESECSGVRLGWEGSDPAPGTGIRSFDVQVAGADGLWTDWLVDTTERSGVYPPGPESAAGAYGDSIGFRVRARDQAGNVGSYSAARYTSLVDTTPPYEARPSMLSPVQTPPFMLHWMGADTCGPLTFDVEYRVGDSSIWNPWLAATPETRGVFNPPAPQYGQQYTFRIRARDMGGNSTESDTVFTRLAKYSLRGDIVTVRRQPVIWPQVVVTGALASEANFGQHVAYLLSEGDYDLSVVRNAFGGLPPMQLRSVAASLSGLDFVLPPHDDVIDNGGFEGDGWGGWLPGGSVLPAVVPGGHTGDRAARLGGAGGPSWLSQVLTVPAGGANATLSFLVRLGDAGASTLDVELAGTPVRHAQIISTDDWTHVWLPVDAAGQATTLTFTVSGSAPILLDEVSLGSAISGGSEVRLPLVSLSVAP